MMAELAQAATGPLAGIRIVDLTSVVFGPYATQMLGDLGADIIKVEFPGGRRGGGGDAQRWEGKVPGGSLDGLGPIFMAVNRNKRSLLLDLRDPEQFDMLRKLLRTADAFVSNVRYAGLERLGIDYDAVRAIRPDIVYAHAAGYGSQGQYAGDPAYDDLVQSAAGFADLGGPGAVASPTLLPSLIADKVAGLFLAQAILAALIHKQRTGEGQFVEVPMLECAAGSTSSNISTDMSSIRRPTAGGARGSLPNAAPPRRRTASSLCCPIRKRCGSTSSI